jgi:hypothetical protein
VAVVAVAAVGLFVLFALATGAVAGQQQQYENPGTYTYDVSNIDRVVVELEGAGGGGGAQNEQRGEARDGGAGGSVEATLDVSAFDELEVYVGGGGGGGVNASGGEGGFGRANGGDGAVDIDAFNWHAAAGGGGGSTEILGDGEEVLVAADGGGGGAAWDNQGVLCCDNAGGGGGGGGGEGGIGSVEAQNIGIGGANETLNGTEKNGSAAETVPDRPGFGGDGGDADSDVPFAEAGGDGGTFVASEYLVGEPTETTGGGGEGGARARTGRDDQTGGEGEDGSVSVEPVGAALLVESLDAPEQVAAGDPVELTVEVRNNGARDTQTITASADGLGSDETEVTLGPDESRQVTLELGTTTDDAGSYTVAVSTGDDDRTAEVTVEGQEPEFALANLDPSETTLTEGETLSVSVDVENVGTAEGTRTIELALDGDIVDDTSVTVATGASDTVSLSTDVTGLDPGQYQYSVASGDDGVSGTLTVEAADPGDDGATDDGTVDDGTADDGTVDDDTAADDSPDDGEEGGGGGGGIGMVVIGGVAVVAVAAGGAVFFLRGGDDDDDESSGTTTTTGGTDSTTRDRGLYDESSEQTTTSDTAEPTASEAEETAEDDGDSSAGDSIGVDTIDDDEFEWGDDDS